MEERYRKMFEEVHAPDRLRTEVMDMAEQKSRKHIPLRPLLIAAAVIAALMGTVLAIGGGFDFVRSPSGDEETWLYEDPKTGKTYEVRLVCEAMSDRLTCFPMEDLSPEVQAANRDGKEESKERFHTWEEAAEFLGVELATSRTLEEQGKLRWSDSVLACQCTVSLRGTPVTWIEVESEYEMGRSFVRAAATVWTDTIPREERSEYWFVQETVVGPEDIFREDYLTPGGLETVIIELRLSGLSDEREELYCYRGVFILDGIGYEIAFTTDEADGLEMLKEILDGFQ